MAESGQVAAASNGPRNVDDDDPLEVYAFQPGLPAVLVDALLHELPIYLQHAADAAKGIDVGALRKKQQEEAERLAREQRARDEELAAEKKRQETARAKMGKLDPEAVKFLARGETAQKQIAYDAWRGYVREEKKKRERMAALKGGAAAVMMVQKKRQEDKEKDANKPQAKLTIVQRHSFWWPIPVSLRPARDKEPGSPGSPGTADRKAKQKEQLPRNAFEVMLRFLVQQPHFAQAFGSRKVVGAEWSVTAHPDPDPWPVRPHTVQKDFDARLTEKVEKPVGPRDAEGRRSTVLQRVGPEFCTQFFLTNVGGPLAVFSQRRVMGGPLQPAGIAARAAFCWPTRNLLVTYPATLWSTVLPARHTAEPPEAKKKKVDADNPYAKYASTKKKKFEDDEPPPEPGPLAPGATVASEQRPRVMLQVLWWSHRPQSNAADLPEELVSTPGQLAFDLAVGRTAFETADALVPCRPVQKSVHKLHEADEPCCPSCAQKVDHCQCKMKPPKAGRGIHLYTCDPYPEREETSDDDEAVKAFTRDVYVGGV